MTYEVVFRQEARADLEDIQSYYNRILPSLTDRFLAEFFEKMDIIESDPNLYQIRYRGIKIAPLRKFPYGIHYREKANQIIIYRVLHFKRYFK